jgi:uncharacterized protein YcsI (UPF0317 family)
MYKTGKEIREAIRKEEWTCPTSGQAQGCVQANLAILPASWAYDFLLFCQRNPKPCPLIEAGEEGSWETNDIARGADIRTDIPRYFIYRDGIKTEETTNITSLWQNDFIYFLLGCSFSFEQALISAGLDVRNISENRNVPMYITNILCRDAGRFRNIPMVVSMRPFNPADAIKAVEITRDYPSVHGSPVHLGDPALIGIQDINDPDFGEAVTIYPGEIPVFWACGVTPQMAVMKAKPSIMISHAPGHMFVGDMKDREFKI